MRCGVYDLRAAHSYLTVRRAARWEKTPQIAADLQPQQKAGEICGLEIFLIQRFARSYPDEGMGAVTGAVVETVDVSS